MDELNEPNIDQLITREETQFLKYEENHIYRKNKMLIRVELCLILI